MKAIVNGAVLAILAVFLAGAPWILDLLGVDFWLDILTEILIWSLFAASVNLLFGYTGLLSFGQALFFGFGMYGVAIGVAKLGLGFWPALGLGMFVSIGMAAITGALAVRLTWHYFAIITVVFSLIFYFIALSAKPLTGGDDGTPFSMPPMFTFGEIEVSMTNFMTQYFFVLAMVMLAYYLKYRLVRSPLGLAFASVRENDARAEMIGLNVYLLRLTSFIVAGALAGLSGCLFALFGRYASATYMFYHVSGEGVVWMLIGGAGTIFGPILGTALVILVREELSNIWEHYLILVGLVVILAVAFAPRGLMGIWNGVLNLLDRRDQADDAGREQAASMKASSLSVETDTRRRVGARGLTRDSTDATALLEIKGLSKYFGGLAALDKVDMALEPGRLHAIIGPNGAGKTTLFNVITGTLPPTAGKVVFCGRDITDLAPHRVSQLGLARTLQIKSVFDALSVEDNIWIAAETRRGVFRPFSRARDDRETADKVEAVLEETGLTSLRSEIAGTLSYGDVALLEIGLALATEPRLLLLDEPICGMGPSETQSTIALIRELSKRIEIIIIEHDMPAVFDLADEITVMVQGRILAKGAPDEIAKNAAVREAYLGDEEEAHA